MNTVALNAPSAPQSGLPLGLIFLIFAAAVIAAFSPSPLIGTITVVAYLFGARLLWQSMEAQALFFAFSYQWFQVSASVWQAFLDGISIADNLGGEHFEMATMLSALGLVFWVIGIKLTIGKLETSTRETLMSGLRSLKLNRLILAWVALNILNLLFAALGIVFPAIRQALLAFEILKWLTVLLLIQRWLVLKEGGILAFIIVSVELGVGILGFFSSFKTVFFVSFLAASGVAALTGKASKFAGFMGALVIFMLVIWQGVKSPYRNFLNQGQRSQTVDVSVGERLKWLQTALGTLDGKILYEGWRSGLQRMAYIEYFGHAIRFVPTVVPHTNGQLWKEAVMHPLTPRMLFPNKPAINDSDRTNAYTGQFVAGFSEGTSVSIGYIGESYIDFGKFLMFAPILLWGGVVGFCYKVLRRNAPHPIFGSGLTCCFVLSNVLYLETSNIKLTGGLLSSFLVLLVVLRFSGRRCWSWLCGGKPSELTEPNSAR